jgi:hypothetical protein
MQKMASKKGVFRRHFPGGKQLHLGYAEAENTVVMSNKK